MSMVCGSLDESKQFVESESLAKRLYDNFKALASEAGLTIDGHNYKQVIQLPMTPEIIEGNTRMAFIGISNAIIEHLKASMSIKGIVSTDGAHAVSHSLVVHIGETPYTVTGTITDPERSGVTQNNDGIGHVE